MSYLKGRRGESPPLLDLPRFKRVTQNKFTGELQLLFFLQGMILRSLNIPEKPFQSEAAVEALAAGDVHRLFNDANARICRVGFSDHNILAVLIHRFEVVVVCNPDQILNIVVEI